MGNMNRDRRSRRHTGSSNWKNGGQRRQQREPRTPQPVFRPPRAVTMEQIREDEEAISAFKAANQPVCECCGRPIMDMASVIASRESGNPIHFDCALEILAGEEKLAAGEKFAYIGQGRFGIVFRENPHDVKHFSIRKIIEWEAKDKKPQWRDQMADLYSKVH